MSYKFYRALSTIPVHNLPASDGLLHFCNAVEEIRKAKRDDYRKVVCKAPFSRISGSMTESHALMTVRGDRSYRCPLRKFVCVRNLQSNGQILSADTLLQLAVDRSQPRIVREKLDRKNYSAHARFKLNRHNSLNSRNNTSFSSND